jgi:hypothetical protein
LYIQAKIDMAKFYTISTSIRSCFRLWIHKYFNRTWIFLATYF